MASCHRFSVQTVSITNSIDSLQAFNVGTSTEVPPDLKRFYFGHVHCPAALDNECKYNQYEYDDRYQIDKCKA